MRPLLVLNKVIPSCRSQVASVGRLDGGLIKLDGLVCAVVRLFFAVVCSIGWVLCVFPHRYTMYCIDLRRLYIAG